jgi:uncharacterized membrane protein YoaK (UPF0700 family)
MQKEYHLYRKGSEFFMVNLKNREILLHSIMCMIGGFFGVYAIMCRMDNLGSAQTNNLILIVCCLLGKNFIDFLLRVAGAFLYVSAISICIYLREKTTYNTKKYAICIDILGMLFLRLIPLDINPIIGLLPIFFMMATQWTVFQGVGAYNSSSIFSTNNLKQMTISFMQYRLHHDPEKLERGKFFANSLIWYHLGVIYSFIACTLFSADACVCALPLGIFAFILVRQANESTAMNKIPQTNQVCE